MDGKRPGNNRQEGRQPIFVRRDCSLGIITFKYLEWTDHVAHLVDISKGGVGIESGNRIEPGFVWFRDRVGGFKGGVLMWSKRQGSKYRGGIRFVPLSRDEEQYIQEQVHCSLPHRPLRDPEAIISTLIESIKKEKN